MGLTQGRLSGESILMDVEHMKRYTDTPEGQPANTKPAN